MGSVAMVWRLSIGGTVKELHMDKRKALLLVGTHLVVGSMCWITGYFCAHRAIFKQCKGELMVEENETRTPNLYLRFTTEKDLHAIRKSKYVVCKIIKTNAPERKRHETGKA